jgi:FkbM family methyltransferase
MAKQFPGGRVFAIEVMPQYCELIRKNAGRNQLHNLTVVQAAIGDGKTNAEIRYWFTEAAYLKVTALVPSHVNAETLTVPSIALQHAFDDNHIQACDLLKVDIEGHEYAMFSAAAPACLRRCRQIAMEWHLTGPEGGPRQLAEQLRSAGFQILPATTLEGDMGFLYALRKD